MTDQATARDWEAFAESYKRIAEVAVMRPIQTLLEDLQARMPLEKAVAVLDVGSGPATIMARLIEKYGASLSSTCALTCIDYAPSMIDEVIKARHQALAQDSNSVWKRVDGKVLDALNLEGIGDESQSHVAAGLLYNLTTNPAQCLAECERVLQPDGVLAVSAWEGNDWIEMLRVISALKPELKGAVTAKWTTTEAVEQDMKSAKFHDVQVHRIEVQIPYKTHEIFVDTLMKYQPRMSKMLKDFTGAERSDLRRLLLEEIKLYCRSQPGYLNGVVLVGSGLKTGRSSKERFDCAHDTILE